MKRKLILVLFAIFILIPGSLTQQSVSAAPRAQTTPWDPQIAIVWPHDGRGNTVPVSQASFVNVSVWPRNQVSCNSAGAAILSVAKGNEHVPHLAQVETMLRTVEGVTFPTLEYNNIAVDSGTPYRFSTIPSVHFPNSNVWVHAADARTIYPEPILPTGYRDPTANTKVGSAVVRIQLVWPHDQQGRLAPVDTAPLVNIAVDLLFPDSPVLSVPTEYADTLTLLVAEKNGPLQPTTIPAQKVFYEANGQAFPRWVFNDVPVEPGQQYHFVVHASQSVDSPPWTHAADPRTILPNPQVPPPCVP